MPRSLRCDQLCAPLLALLIPLVVSSALTRPAMAVEFPPELPWSEYATDITAVDGLAFDAAGRLHATEEISPGRIIRILADGTQVTWVEGLTRPDGILYNDADNSFYISEEVTPGRVRRVDAAGTVTVVVPESQINGPEGLARAGFDRRLFIAEDRNPGRIRTYDPVTGEVATFVSGLQRAEGIAFHPGGDLFVAETLNDRILRIRKDGSTQEFAAGIFEPDNIIWSPELRVFLVGEDIAQTGRLFWITEEGDVRVFATGINAPQGMAFDSGGNLYVSDQHSNRILRVDGVHDHPLLRVRSDGVTLSSTRILWQSFRRASSQIEYGLSTSYGSFTPVDTTLVVDHALIISGLEPETTYHYRVRSVTADGSTFVSGDRIFATTPIPTQVHGETGVETVRARFAATARPTLSPRRATLLLQLPAPGLLRVDIFDPLGRRLTTLGGRRLQAGEHRLEWDGHTDHGERVPSGVYFYRARAAGEEQAGRIVLIR